MIFAFTNHRLALKFEFEESDFDAGLANEGDCIPKVLREGLGGGVEGGGQGRGSPNQKHHLNQCFLSFSFDRP